MVEIPKFHEFMTPLLLVLRENGEMYRNDAFDATIEKVGLTEEQKSVIRESTNRSVARERVGWASSYLKQAGGIIRPKRGYMYLGPNADDFLSLGRLLTVADIKKTKEWQAIHNARQASKNEDIYDSPNDQENDTPQDLIDKGIKRLNSQLIGDLIDNFKNIDPASFESLVLKVLAAMGYGGGDERRIQGVPRGPDGGIDGKINEDKLGLDQIYIQAKRYSDNSVSRPTIQSFVGAMTGGGCRKGVFVTSSSFTSEAIEFAKGLRDQRLILIDGVDLAKLMIEHSVGVQVKEVIKVSKIDQDFFSDDES